MRSQILTGAAVLMGMLLTGCGAESGPTAENTAGLAADAVDHNTGNHTKLVEVFTEPLTNPCNGEVIVFSGDAITQINEVNGLHRELLGHATGTGIGPESGASYTYNLVFQEAFQAAPEANFYANANARVISSVRALSFTAHFVAHAVFLPSGEFKVTRNVDRVECKA
jgi:hypothetical protein